LNHPTVVKFLLAERGLPIGLTNRKSTSALSGEARVMLREAWHFLWDDAPQALATPPALAVAAQSSRVPAPVLP
jgi:hypothetical protein